MSAAGRPAPDSLSTKSHNRAPPREIPGRGTVAAMDRRLLAALAALVLAAPAAAADKRLEATRASGAIDVDGALAEAAWTSAAPVRDFTQKEPRFGEAPLHPTEVRIVYDGDALYVGARMWDAPGATRTVLTRRDETTSAERFIVSFDPYRTRRLAYSFAVTVAGVRADWIHTDDSEYERDASWNPVWSAATRRLVDGWSAELRIPWSQLRYPRGDAPWGVNFNRYVPDRNEDDFWISVPRERTAWSSSMGELRGLSGLPRRLGLELLPYVAGAVHAVEDTGDLELDGNVGGDARVGLGASRTLDVSINPDFGQVEADPAIVNLTAFEVSLPERRPFFVAGNEIFAGAPAAYFYSRRIGAVPAGTRPADATSAPAQVRILGAAKLSGRIGDHGTVGALAAITAGAEADTPAGPVAVAPTSAWLAARAERELGASRLGATVAAVGRAHEDALAPILPGAAIAGGVDGLHRWDDGGWELAGHVGGSALTGDAAAIARVQRSSAHYFQRPDQDHKRFDPTRTSLVGWAASASVARRSGSVRGNALVSAESPGYDLNPTGRLGHADDLDVLGDLGWYDSTPSSTWHAWDVGTELYGNSTFGGEVGSSGANLQLHGTTPGFLDLELVLGTDLPGLSETTTRGGPVVRTPGAVYASLGASARGTSDVQWSTSLDVDHSPTGHSGLVAGASLTLRTGDRLRLALAPHLLVATDRRLYVTTVDDEAATATFGQRYVFARIDRLEVSAQLRAAITLTPDLAVDVYVEPFVSRGRYDDFGELARPGSGEIDRYARVTREDGRVLVGDHGFVIDEPDFTERSLRSTAVLRWEPRAGSVLYVVWQQARGAGEARARAVGSGLVDAALAPGEHTVAVKLSWWFAR